MSRPLFLYNVVPPPATSTQTLTRPAPAQLTFSRNRLTLLQRMVVHNASILEPHTWQSSWWEWVFNLRGLLYYSKDTLHTYTAGMYLIGEHKDHFK